MGEYAQWPQTGKVRDSSIGPGVAGNGMHPGHFFFIICGCLRLGVNRKSFRDGHTED